MFHSALYHSESLRGPLYLQFAAALEHFYEARDTHNPYMSGGISLSTCTANSVVLVLRNLAETSVPIGTVAKYICDLVYIALCALVLFYSLNTAQIILHFPLGKQTISKSFPFYIQKRGSVLASLGFIICSILCHDQFAR